MVHGAAPTQKATESFTDRWAWERQSCRYMECRNSSLTLSPWIRVVLCVCWVNYSQSWRDAISCCRYTSLIRYLSPWRDSTIGAEISRSASCILITLAFSRHLCVLERVCTYTEVSATKISAHKFLVWCHGKVFEDAFGTLLDCNTRSWKGRWWDGM